MRIAVVGPTYPYRGGIAHYTTLLVRHLRAAGHTVPLYSFTRQYPRWLFPGKTDRDPSSTPLKVDCEYILDPMNPLTWWRLYRRIRTDQPDLLVLQWWVPYWTPTLTMLTRWIKNNTSVKIVFICHNVVPHEGGGVIDRRLALTALCRGDALIVHSEQDRYRLHALLPYARVIKANLPTYADLAGSMVQPASDLRQGLGLPPGRQIILFFGFVRPYKGLEYLVQAMRAVREHVDAHLLVVGEFWTHPNFYQTYAEEFGVSDAMTIVNRYVANEELQPYFDLADVVVLPYVSATQSAVVQLAFGFGKPVITTRVGGLHEVVQDGVNGLIVPPQDEQALAEAIVRYFNEELAPELTANVRQTAVAQSYSWQQLVSTIEQTAHELGESS
ncbi:glycosyltransferase [Candidatus Viridilinea mediisalina]|uniref:Glycosyl transferase family 1 n=1 Tax=Candidatus Viridilinea mediisalina TaxID=2024553 RepID=A0A2A6RLW1_9CHLR|nr:glycosyltransferase [Candidatus Viridilinea mediisalina]PDW03896.1 glycosyl transferase family 1 [Candidatus Viridilinea mediisalina]